MPLSRQVKAAAVVKFYTIVINWKHFLSPAHRRTRVLHCLLKPGVVYCTQASYDTAHPLRGREVCLMKAFFKMIAVLAVLAGVLALVAAVVYKRKPEAAEYITLYGGPDESGY